MANPKKRKSKSAVRTNRAHLALTKVTLNKCPQCGKQNNLISLVLFAVIIVAEKY